MEAIPLCIEAFRIGKKVRSRIATLRTYMEAVEECRTKLSVQVILFESECKHILKHAAKGCLDPEIGKIIIERESRSYRGLSEELQQRLAASEIDVSLQSMFGNSLQTLMKLICIILKKIDRLAGQLDQYGDGSDDRKEAGVGSSVNRARNGVMMALSEEKYSKSIDNLGDSVSSLRELRKSAFGSNSAKNSNSDKNDDTPQILYDAKRMPSEFRVRGQDATILLQGLAKHWKCSSGTHDATGHEAKLLLATSDAFKPSASNPSCLDIIIHRNSFKSENLNRQLCVIPMPRQNPTGLLSPESSSELNDDEQQNHRETKRQKLDRGRCKAVIVKATDCVVVDLEISELGDVCSQLCPSLDKSSRLQKGYLSFKNRRFEFSNGHAVNRPEHLSSLHNGTTTRLQSIFTQDPDDSLGDAHRYWLASIIVKAALSHFNTAWWREHWTLDQLSFYELDTDDLAESLKTLHLSAELPSSEASNDDDVNMTTYDQGAITSYKGKQKAESAEILARDMLKVGIRNLTLWEVGVALLQIGLWRAIPSHDHVQVRQSVAGLEKFSRRYHDITEQLINCDFGQGANLRKLELQNAVYRSVLCELDETLEEFREAGIW